MPSAAPVMGAQIARAGQSMVAPPRDMSASTKASGSASPITSVSSVVLTLPILAEAERAR